MSSFDITAYLVIEKQDYQNTPFYFYCFAVLSLMEEGLALLKKKLKAQYPRNLCEKFC